MGVAGKGKGQSGGYCGIKGMGMVREQDGECFRVAQRQQFREGSGDGGVVVTLAPTEDGAAPAQTEQLQGMTAHRELGGFINQQRNPGSFHPRFKRLAALEQVMIAFDHVNARPRIEAADSSNALGNFVKRAVDQVAGHQDEFGTEIVHRRGHLAEDCAPGESARVHVAHVRNGKPLESGGQVANGDSHPADSELFELPKGDRRETYGKQLRSESGGSGQESAAAHSGTVSLSICKFPRLSRSDFTDHPPNNRHDCADCQKRKQKG